MRARLSAEGKLAQSIKAYRSATAGPHRDGLAKSIETTLHDITSELDAGKPSEAAGHRAQLAALTSDFRAAQSRTPVVLQDSHQSYSEQVQAIQDLISKGDLDAIEKFVSQPDVDEAVVAHTKSLLGLLSSNTATGSGAVRRAITSSIGSSILKEMPRIDPEKLGPGEAALHMACVFLGSLGSVDMDPQEEGLRSVLSLFDDIERCRTAVAAIRDFVPDFSFKTIDRAAPGARTLMTRLLRPIVEDFKATIREGNLVAIERSFPDLPNKVLAEHAEAVLALLDPEKTSGRQRYLIAAEIGRTLIRAGSYEDHERTPELAGHLKASLVMGSPRFDDDGRYFSKFKPLFDNPAGRDEAIRYLKRDAPWIAAMPRMPAGTRLMLESLGVPIGRPMATLGGQVGEPHDPAGLLAQLLAYGLENPQSIPELLGTLLPAMAREVENRGIQSDGFGSSDIGVLLRQVLQSSSPLTELREGLGSMWHEGGFTRLLRAGLQSFASSETSPSSARAPGIVHQGLRSLFGQQLGDRVFQGAQMVRVGIAAALAAGLADGIVAAGLQRTGGDESSSAADVRAISMFLALLVSPGRAELAELSGAAAGWLGSPPLDHALSPASTGDA